MKYVIKKSAKLSIFYRHDNLKARKMAVKISSWLKKYYPDVRLVNDNPKLLIVLGGDGAILEAVNKYHQSSPVVLGLNFGQVGFLASARNPKYFLRSIKKFMEGRCATIDRMMVQAEVVRNKKIVFQTRALNEVVAQNILGMVNIAIYIDNHLIQNIRGTGLLVSTATGSTAHNLSAHGPIIMPDIKCLVITELFDHNIPTPSIVIKKDRTIILKILNFRNHKALFLANNGEPAEVLLIADGNTIFPLKEKDLIKIKMSPQSIKFVELETNYFFKSLQEKFAFK